MSQLLLLQGNPRKRKSRKHRSAAQRRAAAKLVAFNRARRNPSRRKHRVKHRRHAAIHHVYHNPSKRTSRRARRSGGGSMRFTSGSIMGMLKPAFIGGAGAVVVDVGMGVAQKFLPATMVSPFNADGTQNWFYRLTKGGLAIVLGVFGQRVLPHGVAQKMAEGSLTVQSYEIIRSIMPQDGSIPLGYVNPARIVSAQNQQLGRVLQLQGQNTRSVSGVRLPVSTRAR